MATGAIAAGFVLSALSTAVRGQAIIGDGNLILGVGRNGHLNVDYERVDRLGLPSVDPAGVGIVGLRSPDGRITAVEKGSPLEGWGAGIRDGGDFLDECGTEYFFHIGIDPIKFVASSDGERADSKVLCGDQKLLEVRHRFRPADRRDCRGAYEIKVNIQNRACRPVRDVIYRRSMDWDIDPSPFREFVTIQDINFPFLKDVSNNGFCDMTPSSPCNPIDAPDGEPPIDMFGPIDQGAHFDLDLGELDREEGVVIHMIYGKFDDEREARKCLDGANIGPYSFAQDDEKRNLFMFGIRRNPSKYRFNNRDCIDWDGRGSDRSFRDEMDGDDDFRAEATASGYMSEDDKMAANTE